MGNCLRREPATVWAGDDWAESSPDRVIGHERQSSRSKKSKRSASSESMEDGRNNEAEENVLFDYTSSSSSSCSGHDDFDEKKNAAPAMNNNSSSTEVKVRITKKQLEELLKKVELQGLSVEQLLEQLIHVTDHQQQDFHMQQGLWRPALSSIPEAVEPNNNDR